MAGIQELKAMVSDNPEAAAIANAVEQTLQQTIGKVKEYEGKIGEWESKFNEAVVSRDKVKDIIKRELNIDEFSADAVRNKLSSYASDDAIAAREKQFNELKATSANKIEELEQKLQNASKVERDMKLKLAISKTDVMGQTKGEHANEMLMQWISENASFDEQGNIIYKGDAGETLYNDNGEPLTLEDRINQIKGDPSRDFVFQSRFLQGGGAPTDKKVVTPQGMQDGGKFTRTTMGPQEKKAYIDKYGMDAYQRLPMV